MKSKTWWGLGIKFMLGAWGVRKFTDFLMPIIGAPEPSHCNGWWLAFVLIGAPAFGWLWQRWLITWVVEEFSQSEARDG